MNRITIDYAVEHLWLLTSAVYALGGGELKTQRYIEISHPSLAAKDNRTPEQIKADILAKFQS